MIKRIIKSLIARKKGFFLSVNSYVAKETLPYIGEASKISSGVSCSKNVIIGRFSTITGPNTKITAKINKVRIGSFCSIAPGVLIQEYSHNYDRVTSYFVNRNIFNEPISYDIVSKGDIIIEDDVWIGANVIILPGVSIGRGAIIAAGSVVTKNVPRYTIYAGSPAKEVKKRFKDSRVPSLLEEQRWWLWPKAKLFDNKELFKLNESEIIQRFFE